MVEMKYIIITPILFAAVVFAVYKIKKGSGLYTGTINTADVKIGTTVFVIVLTVLNAFNFIFSDTPLFPLAIWIAAMFLLICSVVFYSKSCKNVDRIMYLLNKTGSYKDISDALFTGFLHFGTSMPPRGSSKEICIYRKGFQDFAHAVFEQNGTLTEEEFSELIALQKIVRKNKLTVTLLIGAVCAWFLMVPVVIIAAIMR